MPQPRGAAVTPAPPATVVRPAVAEPIDLMGTAGAPILKRLAPVAVVAVLALVLLRRCRA